MHPEIQYPVYYLKMKSKILFVSLVALIGLATAYRPIYTENTVIHNLPDSHQTEPLCNINITPEIKLQYSTAIYRCMVNLFKKNVVLSEGHSTYSPHTMWKALAAIAEGSEGTTKQELYNLLSLPEDMCLRTMFYQLASSREYRSNDVSLDRKRIFFADSSVTLNQHWEDFVKSQRLIDVSTAPFKSNPTETVEKWRRSFDAYLPALNLEGNSVILESLDYNGLFTYAFPEKVVREPFYNVFGEQIGSMEYMRMRRRVSMCVLPNLNLKVMELPVGRDGRYKMLFGLFMNVGSFKTSVNTMPISVMFDALKRLKKTQEPVDIAIPRLTMTSETDVRRVLEEYGIRNMWEDPYGTSNISTPAALPSAFIQRVTVTLDNRGVRPPTQEYANFVPPLLCERNSTAYDFIANQPFMFGLVDSQTYTLLFASIFTKPN